MEEREGKNVVMKTQSQKKIPNIKRYMLQASLGN